MEVGNTFLSNVGYRLQDYVASQPRRPQSRLKMCLLTWFLVVVTLSIL
jgi:hypothetical protein